MSPTKRAKKGYGMLLQNPELPSAWSASKPSTSQKRLGMQAQAQEAQEALQGFCYPVAIPVI